MEYNYKLLVIPNFNIIIQPCDLPTRTLIFAG